MSKNKTKTKIKDVFANQSIHVVSDRIFRSAYSPQLEVTTSCSSSITEQEVVTSS